MKEGKRTILNRPSNVLWPERPWWPCARLHQRFRSSDPRHEYRAKAEPSNPTPQVSVANWLWNGPDPTAVEASFLKEQKSALALLAPDAYGAP
jgi:hypothetical protein